jgi:hypothetical protein
VASALIDLPLIYRNTKHRDLSRGITGLTAILIVVGIAWAISSACRSQGVK